MNWQRRLKWQECSKLRISKIGINVRKHRLGELSGATFYCVAQMSLPSQKAGKHTIFAYFNRGIINEQ